MGMPGSGMERCNTRDARTGTWHVPDCQIVAVSRADWVEL